MEEYTEIDQSQNQTMKDKTQKIASDLHRLLKLYAAKEGRSLQDVTEEILRNGLQSRGVDTDNGTDGNANAGGNPGTDKTD